MAKVSGITTTCTIDDASGTARDISNDVNSIQLSTSRGMVEITGLDKSAVERLLLLADGKITIAGGAINTAANMSHAVLKTCVSSSATRTVAVGYPGATMTMEMVIESYDLDRGEDGKLGWTASLSLADGTVPAWT
jgi:hypothetical protein